MGINFRTIEASANYAEKCGVKSILQTKPVELGKIIANDTTIFCRDILPSNNPQSVQRTIKSLICTLKNRVNQLFKSEPVKREIKGCLIPGYKEFNIEKAKRLFNERTGLNLHVASTDGLLSFGLTPGKVINYLNKGEYPQGIKHLIIGHGTGTTINDTWVISETNEKVFDYITKNIPKGEKALVCCCEETPKNISHLLPKDKAGIGKVVHTELRSPRNPAKIVESGKNEIIGDFASGKANYY